MRHIDGGGLVPPTLGLQCAYKRSSSSLARLPKISSRLANICGGGSSARVRAYRVIGSGGVSVRMQVVAVEAPNAVNGSITVRPAPDSTIARARE